MATRDADSNCLLDIPCSDGPDVEVLRPPSLPRAVRDRLESALRQYRRA
jgi:predicted DNA-binding transcriptional regulator YafY